MLGLDFGVTCCRHSAHDMAKGLACWHWTHCIVCYFSHCNVSTYAAALPQYLGTNVRAEKRVTAVNIGLKTSNDLYTCFRRETYPMRTRALNYCTELGTCVWCLCMLFPKYAAVSNRD